MGKIGKYIYGIINSHTAMNLSAPKDIFETEKIYTIPCRDIAAVVSDSEIVDYTRMQREALARLLVSHQKILEKIMIVEHAIIPMRLGTFTVDEAEIKAILMKGYSLIKDVVAKISDKIEIDVVVTWSNFVSAIQEAGEDKEIKELKEKFLINPLGVTMDDRMKIGIMLKKRLDQMCQGYAFKIQEALKTVSVDTRQHELMDEKMVMNAAFLICKTRQEEFDEQIEKLNNEFAEKLNFRCVGPLPAYSFYTLEIKKMQFEEVNWARKKLEIPHESISKDEIKKAYHRQAFVFHPDKNPDKIAAEKEFNQIKRSYDILCDYSLSCEQAGRQSIDFNEDEFKNNAVLVKVRES